MLFFYKSEVHPAGQFLEICSNFGLLRVAFWIHFGERGLERHSCPPQVLRRTLERNMAATKWQRIEQEQTTLHMEVHSIFGLTKWWNDAYLLLRETLCLKTNSCSGKCSVDNTPRLVSKKCQVNLWMMIYDSGQASIVYPFIRLATVLLKRSRTPWVKIWRHNMDNMQLRLPSLTDDSWMTPLHEIPGSMASTITEWWSLSDRPKNRWIGNPLFEGAEMLRVVIIIIININIINTVINIECTWMIIHVIVIHCNNLNKLKMS